MIYIVFRKILITITSTKKIYRKCTDKPYSFLVIDTTLPSNNLLRFRKNLNITNDDYQRSN